MDKDVEASECQDTITRIRSLLQYQEELGQVVWVVPTSNRVKAGQRFGAEDPRGYRKGKVEGVVWYEHQLVIVLCDGLIPVMVDHIDRDGLNNRRSNLRVLSDRSVNGHNRSAYGKTRRRGVYLDGPRIYARITFEKEDIYLGRFPDEDAASQAVEAKLKELYKDNYSEA